MEALSADKFRDVRPDGARQWVFSKEAGLRCMKKLSLSFDAATT